MTVVRRTLTALLLLPAAVAVTLGVTGATAVADVTTPTLPMPTVEPAPTVTSVEDSVVQVTEQVAATTGQVLEATSVVSGSDTAPQQAAPAAGTTPKLDPGQVPSLPAPPTLPSLPVPSPVTLPSLPGSAAQPPSGGGGTGSGAGSGTAGPLGDDILPAALEEQLCAVLTTVLGHLPGQVSGLPATVIAQLPPQITDVVPADLLRTVTLQCPKAAAVPPSAAPADNRFAAAAPATRTVKHQPAVTAEGPRPARAGLAALAHTGAALAGVPLLGLTLLVLGVVLRRRAQD